MNRTECLESFSVDQPVGLDRAKEVTRLTTSGLDAADRASGHVTPDAKLFVRGTNCVIQTEHIVTDKLDHRHPAYAILVKPDLDTVGLNVLLGLELLLNRRRKIESGIVGRIWKLPPLFLVRAADDELGRQILLLLRRPLTDTVDHILARVVRPKKVAQAFEMTRFFAENA